MSSYVTAPTAAFTPSPSPERVFGPSFTLLTNEQDVITAANMAAEADIAQQLERANGNIIKVFAKRMFTGVFRPMIIAHKAHNYRKDILERAAEGEQDVVFAPWLERTGMSPDDANERSRSILESTRERVALSSNTTSQADPYLRSGEKRLTSLLAKSTTRGLSNEEKQEREGQAEARVKAELSNLIINFANQPGDLDEKALLKARNAKLTELQRELGLNKQVFSSSYSSDNLVTLVKAAQSAHLSPAAIQQGVQNMRIQAFDARSGSNANRAMFYERIAGRIPDHPIIGDIGAAGIAVVALAGTYLLLKQGVRKGAVLGIGLATGVGIAGVVAGSALFAAGTSSAASKREARYHEQEQYFGIRHAQNGEGANPHRNKLYKADEKLPSHDFADMINMLSGYTDGNGSLRTLSAADAAALAKHIGAYTAYLDFDNDPKNNRRQRDIFTESNPGDRLRFINLLKKVDSSLKDSNPEFKDDFSKALLSTSKILQDQQAAYRRSVRAERRVRAAKMGVIAGVGSLAVGLAVGTFMSHVITRSNHSALTTRGNTGAGGRKAFFAREVFAKTGAQSNEPSPHSLVDILGPNGDTNPTIPPDIEQLRTLLGSHDTHTENLAGMKFTLPDGLTLTKSTDDNIAWLTYKSQRLTQLFYTEDNRLTAETMSGLGQYGIIAHQTPVPGGTHVEHVSQDVFAKHGLAKGTLEKAEFTDYATCEEPFPADHGERLFYYGGVDGTPFTKSGDVRLVVGHIRPGQSWSASQSYDPWAAAKAGKLKVIVMANKPDARGVFASAAHTLKFDKHGQLNVIIGKKEWEHSLFNTNGYNGPRIPDHNSLAVVIDQGTEKSGAHKYVAISSVGTQQQGSTDYWLKNTDPSYTKISFSVTDIPETPGTTPAPPDTASPSPSPTTAPSTEQKGFGWQGLAFINPASIIANLALRSRFGLSLAAHVDILPTPILTARRGIGAPTVGSGQQPAHGLDTQTATPQNTAPAPLVQPPAPQQAPSRNRSYDSGTNPNKPTADPLAPELEENGMLSVDSDLGGRILRLDYRPSVTKTAEEANIRIGGMANKFIKPSSAISYYQIPTNKGFTTWYAALTLLDGTRKLLEPFNDTEELAEISYDVKSKTFKRKTRPAAWR